MQQVALAEEVVEQSSSMHDDDDSNFSSASPGNQNEVEVAGRVMRRVLNHVGDNSRSSSGGNQPSPSGSVLGSAAAQRLVAFRHPTKLLVAAEVGTSEGDNDSSCSNDLIGRLTAVLLPNKGHNDYRNGDDNGSRDCLPASAVAAALGAFAGIASQSQAASERVARHPGLLDGLRHRFLEPNSSTATESQEQGEASTKKAGDSSKNRSTSNSASTTCWWWHSAAALRLLRVLCVGSRQVCLALAADGTLQAAKGFLALKPPSSSSFSSSFSFRPCGASDAYAASQQLRLACLESLRLWRVALAYGIDLESLPLVLQLAPPLEHSLQHARNLSFSKHGSGGSGEYDDGDDDGEGSARGSSSSGYFAGPSFGATVAVAVPVAARLASVWGGSAETVANQLGGSGMLAAGDAAVDPLMAGLFWCLEEACLAWHALDARQGDADSDDARAVAGQEAAMDAQRAANLHGNNGDNEDDDINDGGLHERRARQARAAAAMSGVAVPATTLAACGTALKEVATAVRACLLASSTSSAASFMSGPLLPTKGASQLAGLRTCSALASFASTFTAVGLARASQRARLAALHPASAAAFFVPPPPSQDEDVVGNGSGGGSGDGTGIGDKTANEARVEVANAVGTLLGASSDSLEQFCRNQPVVESHLSAESTIVANASALAAARAPVATAVHAYANYEAWREEASALADRAASLCRLWLCLWPQQTPLSTTAAVNAIPGRLGLATLEVLVRRWDRFLRYLLDLDHHQPTVASTTSSSLAYCAPLAYRHGAAGGSASSCRHRAAVRALLMSAAALVRAEVTAVLSSATAAAGAGGEATAAAAAVASAAPLLGCAAEWIALVVPLFEAGHEMEASHALQLYAQVRPQASATSVATTAAAAASSAGSDDNPLIPLTNALELSLEPLAQDARHSFHLLGANPVGSSLSLCGAPLARESLQLLRHGQRQQIAVAAVLAAALAAHHARQQQQQQEEAAAQQAAAGMPPGGGPTPTKPLPPPPPPPLSAQLPLPPHWALLPFLSRPAPRSLPSRGDGEGASSSNTSKSSHRRRRETEVPGGCSADALWASVALARGLEASTINEVQPSRPPGSKPQLTTSHLGCVPPAHKVASLLQLLVFDGGDDDDEGEEGDEVEDDSSRSEDGSIRSGAFAPAPTRVAFGRDVSALFDAWVAQALQVTKASQTEPFSAESTKLGLGFGAQLAAAAEAITPPSPMDRIEALAASACSNTSSHSGTLTVDVGSPLSNRCLERTARHLVHRFADHPPPLLLHRQQTTTPPSSSTPGGGHHPDHPATAAAEDDDDDDEANVNSTVRRALRSFLRTDVSSSVRSAVMRGLAQRQVLHLLAENWRLEVEDETGSATAKTLGGARAFLEPPDQDPDLLRAYGKAVSSLGHRRLIATSSPSAAATAAGLATEVPSSSSVSFLWQMVARHVTADATALRAPPPPATGPASQLGKRAPTSTDSTSTAAAELVPSWGRRQRLADLLTSTPPRTLAEIFTLAPPAITQLQNSGNDSAATASSTVDSQPASYLSLKEALSAIAAEKPALQSEVKQVLGFLEAGALEEQEIGFN